MAVSSYQRSTSARLGCGILIGVQEGAAQIVRDADVELDEVERFYTERGLWGAVQ